MNIYLLQSVGKLLSLLVISLASFQGVVKNDTITLQNKNKEKNISVISKVIEFETEYKYTSRLPLDKEKIVVEGKNGISYIDEVTKEEKILTLPVTQVIEIGTGAEAEYTGRITGYGPDCPGCSLVGNVACFTKKRTKHSLIYDGIYYEDDEYGKVRILAADHIKFPCGTIVLVDAGTVEPFYGVVLDTGSSMRYAWREEGLVWMDLAYSSQADVKNGNVTSRNTKFTIERWGW